MTHNLPLCKSKLIKIFTRQTLTKIQKLAGPTEWQEMRDGLRITLAEAYRTVNYESVSKGLLFYRHLIETAKGAKQLANILHAST